MGFFLGYLHNSVFPPLLTEEEEAANLRALATGSEEAKRILIIHNLRLVAHICKSLKPVVLTVTT